jgi:hypothetical protein
VADKTQMVQAGPVFLTQPNRNSAIAEAQQSRAMAEIQSAMVIAKRFPRDEAAAYARIMRSCQRPTLAEAALYSYPKGGTTVTGPSIRLAEAMAQAWGNMDFGIIELDQRNGESEMQAYAWDLETNCRQTKVFQVKHERHSKDRVTSAKVVTKLDDPRDIYEATANQGARRLRACILGVIPGDVVDAAVAQCEQTMKGESKEPLTDRTRKMVAAFAEHGVTPAMIEKRLGHKSDSVSETELVSLRKVYRSIVDGMAGVEQFFPQTAPNSEPIDVEIKTDTPEPTDGPGF